MVPAGAVDRPAHRVAEQAVLHRPLLHLRIQPLPGVKRLLGDPVGDQLQSPEKPPPPDIADVRVRAEPGTQPALERVAQPAHFRDQVPLAECPLHRERGRAGDRVAEVGVAVLEEPRALDDRVVHPAACEERPDRLVAGAESLGHGDEIGRDRLLFAGVQRPGTAHAAHHLVQDQQDAVAVAQRADPAEVARDGRDRTEGRPDDGFGDERDHVLRPQARDLGLELRHETLAVALVGVAGRLPPVRIARRNVRHVHQQRFELLAAPDVPAGRERTERVAV